MRMLILVAPLALAACAGMNYMETAYSGIPQEMVQYHGAPWPVFHDAKNLRMEVVSSGSDAALDGASFGLLAEPATTYREVAQQYLDQHGLQCRAIGATPILHGAYEVAYVC